MSKNKELAKNTLIILIGKFCTQFLSFFLLPLYTFILSTKEYGTVDLINTYIFLLIPVINLELVNALFRFLIDARNDDYQKKNVFTSIFCGIIGLIIFVSILFIFLNIFIKIDYIYLILFNILATLLSNAALQTARGIGKNVDYTVGNIICAFSTVVLSIIFLLVFKMHIDGILLSIGISNLLCFIYLFLKLKIYNLLEFSSHSSKTLKTALKYSIPLVPNSISWWIINVSDRTMVTYFINAAANGIYSVSNKFSGIFISIYGVFNLSWTESATLHINDQDRDEFFTNTVNTMLKFFCCLGLGIITVMPFVYNILVNKQYIDGYNYIPLLIIGSVFNVIVGLISTVYVAKKLTKEIAKTSLFAAIINILINLFAIKLIGIYGACISTIVAFAAMAIYRYIDVQKYVKIKIKKEIIIILTSIFSISIFLYYQHNLIVNILNLLLIIIFSIYFNKDLLKKGYGIVINKTKSYLKK